MRRQMALIAVLAVALGGAPAADAYRGTVTVALPGEPKTMDPHTTSDFVGTMVWRWTHDSLVSAEAGTGRHLPWLAERWERLGPTKTKFWLRKGVKFTDGTPLTAEAVRYSIGRIVDPETKSQQRVYFKEFDRIEVLDDHTFIWHSKVADNALFNRLARWGHIMSPKTRGWDKARISREPVGSGPYVLKSWTKGLKMVFEANPEWWGNSLYPDRPRTVILRSIQETTTRVKALLADEVDVVMGVAHHQVPEIEKDSDKRVASVPSVRINYIEFNTRHGGPFADRKVRLAVNHAIDVEAIRKTILGGRANPIGQLCHPWCFSGYNPDKKWYDFDLAKAKALMKESSYPNGFKADIYSPVGRYPGDKETCEAVVGMLKKIDIDMTCQRVSWPLYGQIRAAHKDGKRKGAVMFLRSFGNAGGEPQLVLRASSSCGGAYSQHCFKEVDQAIDKAAALADPKEQQAAFERVTDLIKEMALHRILFQTHDIFAFKKGFGFQPRHDETLFPWELVVKRPAG